MNSRKISIFILFLFILLFSNFIRIDAIMCKNNITGNIYEYDDICPAGHTPVYSGDNELNAFNFNIFGIPISVSLEYEGIVQTLFMLGVIAIVVVSIVKVYIGSAGIIGSGGEADKMVEGRNKILSAIMGPGIYIIGVGLLVVVITNWELFLTGEGNTGWIILSIIAIGALIAANKSN